ncbi:hypothetical protein VHEMI05736 [[Torrubiella] hemipterigena]|uniref:Infection structure specific protein n=1 Tax=[Torrubiella] hemipterigena TaxID=1531966 RepID=A0A0A1TJF2_9HYPO|nr:hypothetical protein VHEMI05736 [[Torrubiella] hemipterigena]
MQAKLLLAALVGTAAANAVPRADITKCQADLAALTGIPTPPPALLSALMSMTDPCSFTPPASASAAFKSYTDAQKSWIAAHSSEIKALQTDCPQATGSIPTSYSCKAGGSSPTSSPSSSGSSSGGSSGGSSSGGSSGDGKSAGSRSEIALGAVLGAGMIAVLAL